MKKARTKQTVHQQRKERARLFNEKKGQSVHVRFKVETRRLEMERDLNDMEEKCKTSEVSSLYRESLETQMSVLAYVRNPSLKNWCFVVRRPNYEENKLPVRGNRRKLHLMELIAEGKITACARKNAPKVVPKDGLMALIAEVVEVVDDDAPKDGLMDLIAEGKITACARKNAPKVVPKDGLMDLALIAQNMTARSEHFNLCQASESLFSDCHRLMMSPWQAW
jgi:hypothetical protein